MTAAWVFEHPILFTILFLATLQAVVALLGHGDD